MLPCAKNRRCESSRVTSPQGGAWVNPDIFETAYFFSRIRVNRVLNHSGKWFEKAGCGFNERIHGFHVNDVNGGSFREKKKAVSNIS